MDPHVNVLPILMKNKEGNTVMVGGNCTRTYYFRKCKRKRLTNIESLPEDLLFEILVRLPARDICDAAKLVCRKWYHLIHTHNFTYAHLQHITTSGLLIQTICARQHLIFISMSQGRIEISEYNYKFKCVTWASCNGLVLGFQVRNKDSLYVVNPATKQLFILPQFFDRIPDRTRSGIAYAAASMQHKVVLEYTATNPCEVRCAILTVGVDNSWRHVCTQHLSSSAKTLLTCHSLTTEGFVHWASTHGTRVLTLDVETEIITETPVPLPQVYGKYTEMFYMSTGRYLSLLIACEEFVWEVWEMKPKAGEWTKLPNIDMYAQKCRIEQFGHRHDLLPVGWLKYPDVLVLSTSGRTCIFYNVHTHEIDSIELPFSCTADRFLVHKNSLVSFGGC